MGIQRTISGIDEHTEISIANVEKLNQIYSLLRKATDILISIPVQDHIRSMESDNVAQAIESLELSMSIRTSIGLR